MRDKCGCCRRLVSMGVVCKGCRLEFQWGDCSGVRNGEHSEALPWNCSLCRKDKRIAEQEAKICALQAELGIEKFELDRLRGEEGRGNWEKVTSHGRKGNSLSVSSSSFKVQLANRFDLLHEVGEEEPHLDVGNSRVQQTRSRESQSKSGKKVTRKKRVLLLGSSHGRGVGQLVQEKLGAGYQVTSFVKPSASLSQVTESLGKLCQDFDKEDQVLIVGGAGNSLAKDRNYDIRGDLDAIGVATAHTSVGFVEVLQRHDRPWVNTAVSRVNTELSRQLLTEPKAHISAVPVAAIGRWGYTRHGLHLNKRGKDRLAELLVENIRGATVTQSKIPVVTGVRGAPFLD